MGGTGGTMENKGNKRNSKGKANTGATQTTATALIKREEIITDYIKIYLDGREKRQRWINVLIVLIFILQIAIGILTFGVIWDIQKSNADFITMKRKATEQMLNDYNRQVQEYDRLIRDANQKKQ
jgi:hypothetical protein